MITSPSPPDAFRCRRLSRSSAGPARIRRGIRLREILSQGTSGNAFYIGSIPPTFSEPATDGAATGVPYPFGGWHHFAVVKTSTNAFLYVDGELRATRVSAIPNPAATEFRHRPAVWRAAEYWRGDVDEVRIWNVPDPRGTSSKHALAAARERSRPE